MQARALLAQRREARQRLEEVASEARSRAAQPASSFFHDTQGGFLLEPEDDAEDEQSSRAEAEAQAEHAPSAELRLLFRSAVFDSFSRMTVQHSSHHTA